MIKTIAPHNGPAGSMYATHEPANFPRYPHQLASICLQGMHAKEKEEMNPKMKRKLLLRSSRSRRDERDYYCAAAAQPEILGRVAKALKIEAAALEKIVEEFAEKIDLVMHVFDNRK